MMQPLSTKYKFNYLIFVRRTGVHVCEYLFNKKKKCKFMQKSIHIQYIYNTYISVLNLIVMLYIHTLYGECRDKWPLFKNVSLLVILCCLFNFIFLNTHIYGIYWVCISETFIDRQQLYMQKYVLDSCIM